MLTNKVIQFNNKINENNKKNKKKNIMSSKKFDIKANKSRDDLMKTYDKKLKSDIMKFKNKVIDKGKIKINNIVEKFKGERRPDRARLKPNLTYYKPRENQMKEKLLIINTRKK